MQKKFLILQLRPNDAAAAGEFNAFLKYGNLSENEVLRVRMEKEAVPTADLDQYAGIIVGGGPANVSDAEDKKPDYQKRFEMDLQKLIADVTRQDIPFLGACYGLGALVAFNGGIVSKEKYSEDVSCVDINLSENGKADSIFKDLPHSFIAMAGHKEAVQSLPNKAINLASSKDCPVHMVRMGQNVYATQFHPELDAPGICERIDIYKHEGYFPSEAAESLKQSFNGIHCHVPTTLLHRFVNRYRT